MLLQNEPHFVARKRKLLRHTHANNWPPHSLILVCSHQLIVVKKLWKNVSHQECKHAPGVEVSLHWSGGLMGSPRSSFLHLTCSAAPADGTSTQTPHGNWVSGLGSEPEHHWPIVRLICVLLRGSSPLCSARLHMQLRYGCQMAHN